MLPHVPEALAASDREDGRSTAGAQGEAVKRNRQLPDGSSRRTDLSCT